MTVMVRRPPETGGSSGRAKPMNRLRTGKPTRRTRDGSTPCAIVQSYASCEGASTSAMRGSNQ